MTDGNELVLLLCHHGKEVEVEECHRLPYETGVRASLSADGNDNISVHAEPQSSDIAIVSARGGRWWVSPVGDSVTSYLNRSPLEGSTTLRCGDVLTWLEMESFVAFHPSEDPLDVDEAGEELADEADESETWLQKLQETGSLTAEHKLFQQYYPRVLDVARVTLRNGRLRVFDEDDVAAEAFSEFYAGLAAGKFSTLKGQQELWAMLVCITRRRAIDRIRRMKASHRRPEQVRGESVFQVNSIADVRTGQGVGKSDLLTDIAMIDGDEEVAHFLEFLKACDREVPLNVIARLRMDRVTNAEISTQLDIPLRSIERATAKIRTLWQQHSSRRSDT